MSRRARQLPDVLRRIVAARRRALGAAGGGAGGADAPEAGRAEPLEAASNPFLAAVEQRRGRAIVAEVKMGSPRIGSLAGRVDPRRQAELYAAHGAAALSVVVEPEFFGGSYELLEGCRAASGLPALAKDFVVDPRQLEWAVEAGAAAVLLIAALHRGDELARLAERARGLGLAPLVEVHGASDLALLAGRRWELVGVNNRDLATFDVSLEHSLERAPELPAEALKVSESGLGSGADVRRLAAAGYDAFLVGEALLMSEDPASTLRELAA